MNKRLSIFIFLWLCLISFSGFSQDYRGIWQGYVSGFGIPFNTDYTLHIKTQEGNVITGRAYVYSKKYLVHEGILDFIGDISGNTLKLTELVIINSIVTLPRRSICIKYASLKLSRKDNNTDVLTGFWNGSTQEETECIPGEVYLTRLVPGRTNPDGNISSIMQKIDQDNSETMTFLKTELTKPIILNVSNRQISLEIRDYLREDNDTVSIYYNRKLLINKLPISKKTFKHTVRLERQSALNEIILFANNLGQVPPNTSHLTVFDGVKRHRIAIESTKETSAVIYIKYSPRGYGP